MGEEPGESPQGENRVQGGFSAIFRAAEYTPHGDFQYYSFLKLVKSPPDSLRTFYEMDLVKYVEINSREMLDFL